MTKSLALSFTSVRLTVVRSRCEVDYGYEPPFNHRNLVKRYSPNSGIFSALRSYFGGGTQRSWPLAITDNSVRAISSAKQINPDESWARPG